MSKKILCVDDDKMALELLKVCLEPEGYAVRCAESGKEALEMIAADTPDLIILDIMMPDISGLDILRKVLARDQTRKVPVVMLTSSKEMGDINVAMKLGASSYIQKPFTRIMLLGIIKGFMRNNDKSIFFEE